MKKNKSDKKLVVRFFEFLVYLIVQIIFIPVTILGILIIAYTKKSGKAKDKFPHEIENLSTKVLMHYCNVRSDEESVKLLKNIARNYYYGLILTMAPIIIANNKSEYLPKIVSIPYPKNETLFLMPNIRIIQFDKILAKYKDNYEQIVFIEAGYDTRSFMLANSNNKSLNIFEIDYPKRQSIKIEAAEKADIEKNNINFIPMNLEQGVVFNNLIEQGFIPSQRTLFLLEGLSYYQDEEIVKKILFSISENSTEGSIIVFDFISKIVEADNLPLDFKLRKKYLGLIEEKLLFSLDIQQNPEAQVEKFVEEMDLSLKSYYFGGSKNDNTPNFMAIIELLK